MPMVARLRLLSTRHALLSAAGAWVWLLARREFGFGGGDFGGEVDQRPGQAQPAEKFGPCLLVRWAGQEFERQRRQRGSGGEAAQVAEADLRGSRRVVLCRQPVQVGGEDRGIESRQAGWIGLPRVREPDQKLAEVESDGQQSAESPVDDDHGAGFVRWQEEVLRARVAVRVGLRKPVQPVEHLGQAVGEGQHVGRQRGIPCLVQCRAGEGVAPDPARAQGREHALHDP